MNKCPVCGKSAISALRRLSVLRPTEVIKCRECSTELTLPKWTRWEGLIIIIVMVGYTELFGFNLISIILIGVALVFADVMFIPLAKRSPVTSSKREGIDETR